MPSQHTHGPQLALGSLFYRHLVCVSCTSPQSGGWNWMSFEVLSNTKQSVILLCFTLAQENEIHSIEMLALIQHGRETRRIFTSSLAPRAGQ